jgi:hypothetical protein
MAVSFQQQARQRKLIYGAIILALFSAAWAWRHKVVDPDAVNLGVREEQRGEVELTGAVTRLGLTGSRGLVTCFLAIEIKDAQKRNEWSELEVNTRALTKLQPHFVGPWLYHSWNLSYNVAVEADRIADKYFFITRGIELVAQGERQNHFHPDLRWYVGWYTQHKICISDETNTLRSLFQLSCIPPSERDPARFRFLSLHPQLASQPEWKEMCRKYPELAAVKPNEHDLDDFCQTHKALLRQLRDDPQFDEFWRQHPKLAPLKLDYAEFEDFCRKHPHLVRRLKEGMRRELIVDQRRQFTCQSPEDVERFLADNQRVPSLYEDVPGERPGYWKPKQEQQDRLRPLDERFPVLAPPTDQWDATRATKWPPPEMADGVLSDPRGLHDEDDPYCIARGWYIYSLEPVPDPGDMPGSSKPITDRAHQRKPRYMATVIFRGYPALGQLLTAERLEQEGWFDESGWEITDWFAEWGDRFHNGQEARVGTGRKWAQLAWRRAHEYWQQHGERNGLLFPPGSEETRVRHLGDQIRTKYNIPAGVVPPQLREESLPPEDREGLRAIRWLHEYDGNRFMTNFPHHYTRTVVESREDTLRARKLFYQADTYRLGGSPKRALDLYDDPGAIRAWRDKVLMSNQDFRRDPIMQEQTLLIQLRYLNLLNDWHGKVMHRQAAASALLGLPRIGAGVAPVGLAAWLPAVIQRGWDSPLFGGPFDGKDPDGWPLISEEVRTRVLLRHGERAQPTRKPTGPSPTPAPAGPVAPQ